jgi:predicted ribosome quality control (RQC) complex YloA/Tae2 family protein
LPELKQIPFDSLTLCLVVRELQALVGGRLQRILQPSSSSLLLGIYAGGQERLVLLSANPRFPRAHTVRSRPSSQGEPGPLATVVRRHADGAKILAVRQVGFDRQMEVVLGRPEGEYRLIAELTGKHANLVFVGTDGKILGAAHAVPPKKSARPVLPGRTYERPPFPPRKPIFEVQSEDELRDSEGASPFLLSLLKAKAGRDASKLRSELADLARVVESGSFSPVKAEGWGAYPISVSALGYPEEPLGSISAALEPHFRALEAEAEREHLRSRLLASLRRVLLAREVALEDLRQADAAAKDAGRLQLYGELILAYPPEPGAVRLETQDYEGNPVAIALDPEKSPAENAKSYFDKAKKAKARAGHVREQAERIGADRLALTGTIRKTEDAKSVDELRDLEGVARERRWLHETKAPARHVDEKPYEGHRIRERLGPGGVKVLFGENAESNDYLTQRVARPNDIWLHVRGATSAHVVIQTGNRPERIGPEALRFAAEIAVLNSAMKHSSYVPVDYTLKKYVRKPRGAKAGSATYTHEKTIHVEKAGR